MIPFHALRESFKPEPKPDEPQFLPPVWKLKTLVVEILELPANVGDKMLVRTIYVEDRSSEQGKSMFMTLTPRIAGLIVKNMDLKKLDVSAFIGARLKVKHYSSPCITEYTIELKAEYENAS